MRRFNIAMNALITIAGKRQIAATALIALPLSYLFSLSGVISIPLAAVAMAVLAYVVIYTGFLLLRAVGMSDLPVAAAWVLGIFATSAMVYALVELLHVTAAIGFALLAVFVLVLGIGIGRASPPEDRADEHDMLGLLLCVAATAVWCRGTAAAPAMLGQEDMLPAWVDYFIHGGVISQFGDARALGRESIDLANFPKPIYHYASYLLPAVFAEPLDVPGLPLATSVWLPLGFLTMCAGAYALGVGLAGSAGGVAAVAALTVVPDASSYGLRNGFFSFHWNVQTYAGAGYAIGASLLSATLLHRWAARGSARALFAGALLAAGTAVFRANVFVLAFPAWVASAGISLPFFRRRHLFFAIILVLSVAGSVSALYFILANVPATAETWWRTGPALERFLDEVHRHQAPTAYGGLYWYLLSDFGKGVAIPAGILLVYAASLGIFVLLYPVGLLVARRSQGLSVIDMFPAFVIMTYALLMLFAPSPAHGDSTAFTHLPFVLLYAVVVSWTATMFVNWIARQGSHNRDRLWRTLAVFMICALPVLWKTAGAMAYPKFYWGKPLVAVRTEKGLERAAAFLRRNAKQGDIFATSGLRRVYTPIDTAAEVASLSGMPAYIMRPWVHIAEGGRRAEIATERWNSLVGIEKLEKPDLALNSLRRLGIQWYVFVGAGGPRWDPLRSRAVFSEESFAIYSGLEQ